MEHSNMKYKFSSLVLILVLATPAFFLAQTAPALARDLTAKEFKQCQRMFERLEKYDHIYDNNEQKIDHYDMVIHTYRVRLDQIDAELQTTIGLRRSQLERKRANLVRDANNAVSQCNHLVRKNAAAIKKNNDLLDEYSEQCVGVTIDTDLLEELCGEDTHGYCGDWTRH